MQLIIGGAEQTPLGYCLLTCTFISLISSGSEHTRNEFQPCSKSCPLYAMTSKSKFISWLNWRQILIYFVAFWIFIYAFQTLFVLYDTKLVDIVRHRVNLDMVNDFKANGKEASDLMKFVFGTNIAANNFTNIFSTSCSFWRTEYYSHICTKLYPL